MIRTLAIGSRLKVAANNLLVDSVSARMASELRRFGIECILLKGPTTTRWLFPEGGRGYTDVDLLVSPVGLPRAQQVLKCLGFVGPPQPHRNDRPREAEAWIRSSDGAQVDLHTRLWGPEVWPDQVWSVLIGGSERMEICGVEVNVLDKAARALHLALHAAKHGIAWAHPQQDLARAVGVVPFDVWREAAALADQLRCSEAVAAGLSLVPGGEALAARLGLPKPRAVDVVLAAASAPPYASTIEWISGLPSLRTKLSLVLRKTFPRPDYLKSLTPLASRGTAGLALAYCLRPVSLAISAWPALVAWRRARRLTATTPSTGQLADKPGTD